MRKRLNYRKGVVLAIALACALDSPRAVSLQGPPSLPDLTSIPSADRQMIESACRLDRPADSAAVRCVRQQLDALQTSGGAPDLTATSVAERQMMESSCRADRQIGPAAYYRCLREQLNALEASPGSPDLSAISRAERQRIESACRLDRQMSGPAAYYACLRQQAQRSPAEPGAQHAVARAGQQAHPAGGRARPAAARHSGADSVSTSANGQVQSLPPAESPSWRGTLAVWLAGIFVAGLAARIFYGLVRPKKCGRCGKPVPTRGAGCEACIAARETAPKRDSEQRDVQERARPEAELCAREQWKIEESRRVTVLAGLQQLSASQFEDLIASLFKRDGYVIRACGRNDAGRNDAGRNSDEGIDLVLLMGPEKDVAQCKRSADDIEAAAVREFYGALMHAAARHGFMVATARFTQAARDFARGKPISLISGADILPWIDGTRSSQDLRSMQPAPNRDTKVLDRAFDPYAVLGVSAAASLEEIRAAYRREIVNYHPDKVAHLGRELREFANTKAQEINRAYAELAQSPWEAGKPS